MLPPSLMPPNITVSARPESNAIAGELRVAGPDTESWVHVVPFHSHVSALRVGPAFELVNPP
jgi:hypothetical protein